VFVCTYFCNFFFYDSFNETVRKYITQRTKIHAQAVHIVIPLFKTVNLNPIPRLLFDFSSQVTPQRQTVQCISLLHQGRLVVIDVKRTMVWKQCV